MRGEGQRAPRLVGRSFTSHQTTVGRVLTPLPARPPMGRARLLRSVLVRPVRAAVLVSDGGRLVSRLCRPQREACEVGLASVPCPPCTLGQREHAVRVDLALETIQQSAMGRRGPRTGVCTGVCSVGPRLVRGEPRDQGAVGRPGDEAACPPPVHLRRRASCADPPDEGDRRLLSCCTSSYAGRRHLAAVGTGAPVLPVSSPLQDDRRLRSALSFQSPPRRPRVIPGAAVRMA
jgi:hypothetical protein